MTIARSPLFSDPPFSFASIVIELDALDHDRIPSPSPSASYPCALYDGNSGSEEEEEEDEDDNDDNHNHRVAPHWQSYRHLIESCGYHLDTCKDVRQFYLRYWQTRNTQHKIESCAGYRSACRGDNELCKDEGLVSSCLTNVTSLLAFLFRRCRSLGRDSSLRSAPSFRTCVSHRDPQPERLFRGKRLSDGLPIVIKAVHRRSRELEVITALSTPPLRDDPMNHCIRESTRFSNVREPGAHRFASPSPRAHSTDFSIIYGSPAVLDIIHAPPDLPHTFPYAVHREQLSFIVMEEWSSEFIPPGQPYTLHSFLNSLRCCIQHITFMHSHCFAHLDIAVRNVLTDYAGRYAYIDYETSGRFSRPPVEVEEGGDARKSVLVYQPRAAELPPEVEKGHSTSPYAMDVWALGTLMSKAGKSVGCDIPELYLLTQGMLESQWERRPSAKVVLSRFEESILNISEERLNSVLPVVSN